MEQSPRGLGPSNGLVLWPLLLLPLAERPADLPAPRKSLFRSQVSGLKNEKKLTPK